MSWLCFLSAWRSSWQEQKCVWPRVLHKLCFPRVAEKHIRRPLHLLCGNHLTVGECVSIFICRDLYLCWVANMFVSLFGHQSGYMSLRYFRDFGYSPHTVRLIHYIVVSELTKLSTLGRTMKPCTSQTQSRSSLRPSSYHHYSSGPSGSHQNLTQPPLLLDNRVHFSQWYNSAKTAAACIYALPFRMCLLWWCRTALCMNNNPGVLGISNIVVNSKLPREKSIPHIFGMRKRMNLVARVKHIYIYISTWCPHKNTFFISHTLFATMLQHLHDEPSSAIPSAASLTVLS